MKKLLVGVCAISLLFSSSMTMAARTDSADYTSADAAATKKAADTSSQTKADEKVEPSKVDHVAKDKKNKDVDYSSNAGNKAAVADIGLDAISAGFAAYALIERLLNGSKSAASESALSWTVTAKTNYPTWMANNWYTIFISIDWVGTATQLGHAAINKWMRQATWVTASFAGATGHVTDKWVGPPSQNTTTAVMGEVDVRARTFGALSFNPDNYPGLKDAEHASAYELMQYRSNQLLEDQRSLKNVTDQNWGLLYRAQQRSIQGLAGALQLKSELANLADVETAISAEYGSKPKALNTVANRRVLHDALMLLKLNVIAARTRLRSEILELDFKPKTKENEEVASDSPPSLSPTSGGQ